MGAASPIYMLRSLKSTKYIIYKRGIWERKAIGPTRSVEGMNDGSLFYQIGLKWQQPNILLGREYWESLGVLALFGLCLYQEETAIDVWDRQLVQLQYHSFDNHLVSLLQPIYGKSLIHLAICWPISWTKSTCVLIFHVNRWCIWQILMLSACWLGTLCLSRYPKCFLSNLK